jgi:hypothetical protein
VLALLPLVVCFLIDQDGEEISGCVTGFHFFPECVALSLECVIVFPHFSSWLSRVYIGFELLNCVSSQHNLCFFDATD